MLYKLSQEKNRNMVLSALRSQDLHRFLKLKCSNIFITFYEKKTEILSSKSFVCMHKAINET
jgi:hypothetical protein